MKHKNYSKAILVVLNGVKDYLLGKKLVELGLLMFRKEKKFIGINNILLGLVLLMLRRMVLLLLAVRIVKYFFGIPGLMLLLIGFRGINRKFVA